MIWQQVSIIVCCCLSNIALKFRIKTLHYVVNFQCMRTYHLIYIVLYIYFSFHYKNKKTFYLLHLAFNWLYLEASDPKWVNSIINIIGVNSLRVRNLQFMFYSTYEVRIIKYWKVFTNRINVIINNSEVF